MWWDEPHEILWQVSGVDGARETAAAARTVAREAVMPAVAAGAAESHRWSSAKAAVVAALDDAGLMSLVRAAGCRAPVLLGLASWELGGVDGGVAANLFSGCLPQMAIRDCGTAGQKDCYLRPGAFPHGALCLTEPIPGAGAETLSLTGTVRRAGLLAGGEPLLEVRKRGRLISHMDFADFVLAAVLPGDTTVLGGCLVLLHPDDDGVFDRGAPVRKLGHLLSSTTDPEFRLTIPAGRILGGYDVEGGSVAPRIPHQQALEPPIRMARALVALATSAKLSRAVQLALGQPHLPVSADLIHAWSVAEAGAALSFRALASRETLPGQVLSAAAKLFTSSAAADCLRRILGGFAEAGSSTECGLLASMIADSQVEAVYLGPEAVQRRQIAAHLSDPRFLSWLDEWTSGRDGVLARAMALWRWTLERLLRPADSQGRRIPPEVRQAAALPMADGLSRLLAGRALEMGSLELRRAKPGRAAPFRDLSLHHSVLAASAVDALCAGLFPGPCLDGRATEIREFAALRDSLYRSFAGMFRSQDRLTTAWGAWRSSGRVAR